MRIRRIFYPLFLACFLLFTLFTSVSFAVEEVSSDTTQITQKNSSQQAEDKGDKAKKKDEKSEKEKEKEKEREKYEKAIKGFELIKGLFNLYYNKDDAKAYMEIFPEQLDKIYLCSVFREAGDGFIFDSGAMLDNFPFYFHRVGQRIQFVHKNVLYRAEKGSPIVKAIERGISDSVIASSRIIAGPHPDTGGILVDASPFFIRDHAQVSTIYSRYVGVGYNFDRNESYFGKLKSFPKNTEIEVVAIYRGSGTGESSATIARPTSLRHIYRYSLYTRPEPGYKPRLADDRVGYFMTMFQDYTDLTKETPYVRYIQRWRLEKKYPFEKLSQPKKPIVFWLENTIPEEYREPIKEGVLEWNKAFERIGIKDAIVVKQMPDDADWDPADIRYNVIQWIVNPGSGYAVGPSWADPFTGEIYAADIRISADFVRSYAMTLEEYVNPIKGLAYEHNKLQIPHSEFECRYGEGLMREAEFALSVLAVRGYVDFGSEEAKEFIKQGLKDLVAHEVGHTLGLRHNFKASTIHTLDQLQDKELTAREGLSGSVMEYNVVNVAPKGKPQGYYWQTMLGTYDYWAIEYGYKPIDAETPEDELPELEKIASRSTDPKLAYATDMDTAFPRAVDPLVNRWDASSDPLAFAESRIELGQELMANIEKKFELPGKRFQKLRAIFGRALGSYYTLASIAPKYIGGMYHYFAHIGDPGAKSTFEPVPPSIQRKALRLMNQYLFSEDAFKFSPELLNKLAPERFPDFEGTIYERERVDYPVHEVVLSIQERALAPLYHPTLLSRLVDMPLHYDQSEKPFTMEELFDELRYAIWKEVYEARNINSFRRNLQRSHLRILTSIVLNPSGYPEDAVTLARADLADISDAITYALRSSELDRITRAHLEETLARIRTALTAEVERRI